MHKDGSFEYHKKKVQKYARPAHYSEALKINIIYSFFPNLQKIIKRIEVHVDQLRTTTKKSASAFVAS